MIDLTKLEKLAEAATPGPWSLSSDGEEITQTSHVTRDVWTIPHNEHDMPYIASMNPTTALALIRVARMAKDMYSVAEGQDMPTERWNEIKEALKEFE